MGYLKTQVSPLNSQDFTPISKPRRVGSRGRYARLGSSGFLGIPKILKYQEVSRQMDPTSSRVLCSKTLTGEEKIFPLQRAFPSSAKKRLVSESELSESLGSQRCVFLLCQRCELEPTCGSQCAWTGQQPFLPNGQNLFS